MAARQGHPRGAGSAVSLAQLTLYPHCMSVTSNPMIYCLEGSARFFFLSLSLSLPFSPVPLLLSCLTKLHIFFEEGSKYVFVPGWLAFSSDLLFIFSLIWKVKCEEMKCDAKAFLAPSLSGFFKLMFGNEGSFVKHSECSRGTKGVLHTRFLKQHIRRAHLLYAEIESVQIKSRDRISLKKIKNENVF